MKLRAAADWQADLPTNRQPLANGGGQLAIEVRMPKLTQTMDQGRIIEWLKAEGDVIRTGEPLVVIETDKAAVEVEAPAGGVIGGIARPAGEMAEVGALLVLIRAPATAESPRPAAAQAAGRERVRATPAAKRVAHESGVDLSQVRGTGPDGCIVEADVRRSAALPADAGPALAPPVASRTASPGAGRPIRATPLARKLAAELGVAVEQANAGAEGRIGRAEVQGTFRLGSEAGIAAGPETTGPEITLPAPSEKAEATAGLSGVSYREEGLGRIGHAMAERMAASWTAAPHFYLEAEVDMSEAGRLRDRLEASSLPGFKPSYTAIVVLMVARALRQHPRVNASFVDGRLRLHEEVNVGVALASPEGLIVPVIRRADARSLAEIAKELDDLRAKAERLRFKPEELSGGTFTVSNLGMFGVDRFHAVLNPPEAAILACGRIARRVVELAEGKIESRPLMSLALSVDHRALDGVVAARFLSHVQACLENPYLLL